MIFLYLLTEGDRFVIDMCQSIKFWSENTSLMQPMPKIGNCKILANFWLAKN